jgi:hypothetical protein
MTGAIIRYDSSVDFVSTCWSGPLLLSWLWPAFGAGGPSSRPAQPSEYVGYLVHPLPYTHPSLLGLEILVVANAGEIMARIASENADATATDLSKYSDKGQFEGCC